MSRTLGNAFTSASLVAGYCCCADSDGEQFSDYDIALLRVDACPDEAEARSQLEAEWMDAGAREPEEMPWYSMAVLWVRIDPHPSDPEWPYEILGEAAEGALPCWALIHFSDPLEAWRGGCRLGSQKPVCQQVQCAGCNQRSEEVRERAEVLGYRAECSCDKMREINRRTEEWLAAGAPPAGAAP